jgi:hypothetical protein
MKLSRCTHHACADTFQIQIHTSGSLEQIEQVCRRFCKEVGLCVTVTPTNYIYSGGQESGAIIGLLNYPRFPKHESDIVEVAKELAGRLLDELAQDSILLVLPDDTHWFTTR